MKLSRLMQLYYRRAQRLRGSVDSLALGAALGAAVACTPTMPLHTILSIALALALRANPLAAALAATLVSNPFTMVPLYTLVWKMGDLLFPGELSWARIEALIGQVRSQGFFASLKTLHSMGWDAAKVMLGGGLALALPVGLATYPAARWFFLRIRSKRNKKRKYKKIHS